MTMLSLAIPMALTELKVHIEQSNYKAREPRWPCQKRIEIWHGLKKASCTMVGISSGGACLSEVSNLRKGSNIYVGSPHHKVSAKVIWVIGSRCGIQFSRSLGLLEVFSIKNGDAALATSKARLC
jgi:hypothetical protein